MEGTVAVFAEPRVLEDMGLGKCVPIEEEEMAKGLFGFEGEACDFKGGSGNSGSEGHDDSRRIDRVFIPIFLW